MTADAAHILIIDDNQELLDMVSLMLERHSYRVSTRARLNDFVREIKEQMPSLILMDQHLGWADGCDLCRMVKSASDLKHLPVIMFSAYHNAADNCLFSGADGFLPKPFAKDELIDMIDRFTIGTQPSKNALAL